MGPAPSSADRLPRWSRVLVVVAHPDDESFGLGAVIDAFVRDGCQVTVLCLTRGEASSLGAGLDLGAVRAAELRLAADRLGVSVTILRDYPDGGLAEMRPEPILDDIGALVDDLAPDGLLVFDLDGVTGHPDHATASALALQVATERALPVLGWGLPSDVAEQLKAEYGVAFGGITADRVALRVPVERIRQRDAIGAHSSQAVPGSVLWRRLELLGSIESLCWLAMRVVLRESGG